MAAPVNANINILVNTQQAMGQLKALQAQVAATQRQISTATGSAAAQQAALANAFRDSANASRMWNARIIPMSTAVDQFTTSLDKGKMSLGQYTKFAASQLPGMSRVFKREFELMDRVAEQNVRKMQTQFVQLGNSATGAAQAMALTPTALDRQAASTAIATQRQVMMNRMIDLGTTKLLNWGKNTQWAGRQLMVGFSIPLAMMGAAAAKAFKEIDQSSIAFRRVYGDLQTTTAEMEKNLDAVKELGMEYTKYGQSLSETIDLAAKVAATGAENQTLLAATEQTVRLATLGMMEYGEAMDATISLQTAFQVSNEDLASTIDFLNVVENQTVLSMQDMAVAIPRVAPVIKGLGGDVKDLAIFMTAMREGGISAEQGANALKSGLGRLINPTKAAREEAEKYGISIDAIVQRNRGDILATVTEFGKALSSLGQLEQQQVLQKVFGTYQYARLGALFKNISNDAGQAQRTIELTGMSIEDLAQISERELGKIEEATSVRFQASIEKLKVAIAPIGETFMKALMPVIDFASKILNAFNDLPDGVKNAIAIATAAIAGIGPIVLMTVGLIANGIANVGKLMQAMRKFFARLRGDASAFDYLTQQEMEAVTSANALGGATDQLTGKFLGQRKALDSLIGMLGRYSSALSSAAAAAPLAFGGGARRTPSGTVVSGAAGGRSTVTGPGGIRMAKGGVVPGTGNKDTVPTMLTPGESVITKEATQKYGPMLQAMNAGAKIPGFIKGVVGATVDAAQSGRMVQFQSPYAQVAGHLTGATDVNVKEELAIVEANRKAYSNAYLEELRKLDAAGVQTARTYTNLVALMSGTLNEAMKNGTATISQVKQEIGNTASQVELKRQLQLLGLQDDEIEKRLQVYVRSLNAQLDLAEQRFGTGAIASRDMDRLLLRASMQAGTQTFTDPRERAMFERMATERTTFVPSGTGGRGRRQIASAAATREDPSLRSYVGLRGAYGISAATKFKVADIEKAGLNVQQLQQMFMKMPEAAQRAIISTKGNFEKALPIFQEYGIDAGNAYGKGMVSAISKARPNISQAVAANRQAASPAPWAAPMGTQDGQAYGQGFTSAASKEAARIKQSITSGQIAPSILPGAARQEYRLSQSMQRREAYNIREMQRVGMSDTQILRQLERLRVSKEKQARAQEKEAKAAEQNARLAQVNATLAQQSTTQMTVEEQARKRGLRTRVSEYFATPVGDGTQTRGQALRSRMGAAGGGAAMGLMGLSMAASMAGGSIGEMAQKIMPVAMGLTGLQMILPMFTNPIGLAVLAVGALTASFIKARIDIDNLAKESANAGANVGGLANSMKIISEATGFNAPTNEDRLFRFSDQDREAMAEFSSYFESEAGSKFIQELKNATSEERYQKVARLLAQGIGSGLEPEKAKAFGFAIAEATGDALLKSGIARDFANQVFGSGSEALIGLQKERMLKAPPTSISPEQQRLFDVYGDNPLDLFGQIEKLAGVDPETEAKTALAAKALGFSLQTIQELSIAEAVLEEERRNQLITFDEYEKRSKEINALQLEGADYLKKVYSIGADAGAMAKALGDQLSFAGFDEDKIKRISETFNPDALAKRFFGETKTFATLGEDQQKYVQQVLTQTLSGLTPENIDQKFADIQTTYTEIASRAVQAMIDGTTDVLGGLEGFFNQQNISDYITQRMGGGLALGTKRGVSPEAMATNLVQADTDLKRLGTDSLEVFTRLSEFTDVKFAKSIMASKDEILRFGEAVAKLKDYKNINIELLIKNDVDPDQILAVLDKINKFTFDTETFGKNRKEIQQTAISGEQYINVLNETGMIANMTTEQMVSGYSKVITSLDSMADSLKKTQGGNFVINTQLITTLFGKKISNPAQIAKTLDDAMPDGLTPIQAQILISVLGNDAISQALLSKPEILQAVLAGKTTYEVGYYSAGKGGVQNVPIPEILNPLANLFGATSGTGLTPPTKTKPEDTSGGGAKEDPLKDLQTTIAERLALYSNITKLAGKLEGKKKDLQKALAGLRYEGSFVDQLRDLNLSEQFIAELLSKGYKNAKEIVKRLGNVGLQRLNLQDLISRGKETTSTAVGAAATARKQALAANELRARGVNQDVIESIAGDPAKAEELLGLVTLVKKGVKGSKDAMWEFINAQKDSVNAAKEQQAAIEGINPAIQDAIDAQKEYFDKQMASFDQQYANIEMVAHQEFKARTGMTVEGMELEIKKNEDLIDGYRDRIQTINDEIRVIETRQGKANDYSDFGLEQLQKEISLNNENIRSLERTNELTQRRIDALKREDEIRNRESETLQRDLEKISEAEQQIRDAYQKRIDALDKVAEVNNQIIEQQKQQLGLSRALSEGDIYAATAAAQEMRQSQAQFAQQQARAAMETGMEGAIAGLRTAGGLTREQAEAQIANIKEQSYQTSLLIRTLEDEIYNRQINQILPLKDKEYSLNLALEKVQNSIAAKQLEIRDIERSKVEPLDRQNALYKEQIDDLLLNVEIEQLKIKDATGLTRAELERQNSWILAGLTNMQLMNTETQDAEFAARNLAGQWQNVGKQINNAKKALDNQYREIDLLPLSDKFTEEDRVSRREAAYAEYVAEVTKWLKTIPNVDPQQFMKKFGGGLIESYGMGGKVRKYPMGGLIPYSDGGRVFGDGSRDSVKAMLTPGEFVIRKAMVNKYGIPTMNALNQGSFGMPKYNVGQTTAGSVSVKTQNTSNIVAPMYNNYSVNVSVSNTNASADEIANRTIMKIKQMQDMQIRSGRGY